MCIRDRVPRNPTGKIEKPKLREKYGAAPVSYTHLDVYKRQAITGLYAGNCS